MTTALLDRLRAALAPDYEVIEEVARGGMGVVYLARDRTLDRRVAIKVLPPELATAAAVERFLREARALASFQHPNIVNVHRAGEADGIAWFAMDYLEGETLAQRLARGHLTADETGRLASDLLAALEAIHRHRVVHRDIKPSNVFLLADGRALLGDFGIAKDTSPERTALTQPGRVVGTPGYMAPEQLAGRDVTASTDLYAAAAVLYEALTGREWPGSPEPGRADWSGTTRSMASALTRALAFAPEDRWPDAATMRRALGGGPRRRRGVLAATGVALVAIIAAILLVFRPAAATGTSEFVIEPLADSAVEHGAGDSLSAFVARVLGTNADFVVRAARGGDDEPGGMRLTGAVRRTADGLSVVLGNDSARLRVTWRGPARPWPDVADTIAYQLVLAIWQMRGEPVVRDLPAGAVPRDAAGLRAFVAAERLYAAAAWSRADEAYAAAEAMDPTCLLCAFRREDIARWTRREHDPARSARIRAGIARFSEPYQALIRAGGAPLPERLELLRLATERWPHFQLAQLWRGDELFHRGALAGFDRAEALHHLQRAVSLRPDFGPGHEHVAALGIMMGDAAIAGEALGRYRSGALLDTVSLELLLLDAVAFRWRFAPPAAAAAFTDSVLANPMLADAKDIADGPAYLLSFDVPLGVLHLGRRFAEGRPRDGLAVRGALAQVHALLALGRPDSALRLAAALGATTAEPDLRCFLAQLPAVAALLDPAMVAARWAALAPPLAAIADDPTSLPVHRRRAAWTLALLARRTGEAAAARRYAAVIDADSAAPHFRLLLAADAERSPAVRWQRSRPLLQLDSASSARTGDPFLRALTHLLRARWAEDAGDPMQAARDLLWYRNADYVGYSASHVQSAEVDWALGTLARWRRAPLLEAAGATGAACRDLADLVRLWSAGEPAFVARAADAARRRARLGCPTP